MCLFACLCKSKWGVSGVAVLARKCVPPVVGAPNLQYRGGGVSAAVCKIGNSGMLD